MPWVKVLSIHVLCSIIDNISSKMATETTFVCVIKTHVLGFVKESPEEDLMNPVVLRSWKDHLFPFNDKSSVLTRSGVEMLVNY